MLIYMKNSYIILTFFIIIVVIFVFIQLKGPIGARIDAQLDRVGRLFRRVLEVGPQRQNGAGPDMERDAVEGRGRVDPPAAVRPLTGPEVVPLAGREVDRAGGSRRPPGGRGPR